MKKNIVFFLSIFTLQVYAADRSVSIAAENGKLTLVNGSSVTVTYTAECYDRSTGSNILTGAANVTLAPKADISYESSGACAGGASPLYKSPQNVVACAGSTAFSGAAALCGAGSNLCSVSELLSRSVTSLTTYPDNYWFAAGVDPIYITWDNWSKNYPYATTGGGKVYQVRTYTTKKGGTNNRCNTSAGAAGSGIGYCTNSDVNISLSGSLCCPTNNGFKSCKVTILSATPAAGHLQSPQFKGGASF